MRSTYLAFNPGYRLRQDGNRVVLFGEESHIYKTQEWFSFIHPYQAQLLSFFKGIERFEIEVAKCATYFKKDIDSIRSIIRPFVENSSWFTYKQKDGSSYCFPKNVLIWLDNQLDSNIKNGEFRYLGKPDCETNRLQFPININLELIMSCYTDCEYCYADRKSFKGLPHLSTERILSLIDEAKRENCFKFDINGGEVLYHKDIYKILNYLVSNGFSPLVSTKIPLGRESLEKLKESGIKDFQISLDSVNNFILMDLLHTPTDYLEKIENTLEEASNLDLKVKINTVLTTKNSNPEDVENLLKFLIKFSCVDGIRLNPVGLSLYKDYNAFIKLFPSEADIRVIERAINEWRIKYDISIELSSFDCKSEFTFPYRQQNFHRRAICTGNLWNAVILPNGDVTVCEELYKFPEFNLGNICDVSLREIWNGEKALKLYYDPLSEKREGQCAKCDEYKLCRNGAGVCWKTILMAYGKKNWHYPDPRCPKAPTPYYRFFYE